MRTLVATAVVTIIGLGFAGASRAQTATFNFDADALGTQTAFTDTNNGISATFASPADPGGFNVGQSIFVLSSGHALFGGNNPLFVTFDHKLSSVSLTFAENSTSSATFALTALSGGPGGTVVGRDSEAGTLFTFVEGTAAFSGLTFDAIQLSSTAPDVAVDNIVVSEAAPTAAPEPGAGLLLASALPFAALRRRRSR